MGRAPYCVNAGAGAEPAKKKDRERTPRRSRSFPRIFANALVDKGVSLQTTAFSPGPPGAPGASPGSRTVFGPATTTTGA